MVNKSNYVCGYWNSYKINRENNLIFLQKCNKNN